MLTVVLACEASGNSSTLRPLARSYWVIPSPDGPWLTPGGSAACAVQHNAAKKTAANTRRIECERAIMEVWSGEGAPIIGQPWSKEIGGQWTFGTGESSGRWAISGNARRKIGEAPAAGSARLTFT